MPRSRTIGEMERAAGRVAALVLLATAALSGLAGCRLGQPTIEANPMSWTEQKGRLEEIAPLGTPRDEAIERLRAAGIEGEFGARDTIYYCGSWDRPDGIRRRMDVALLFDADGKLYEFRPGDAEVRAVSTGTNATPAGRASSSAASRVSTRTSDLAEPQLRDRPAPR